MQLSQAGGAQVKSFLSAGVVALLLGTVSVLPTRADPASPAGPLDIRPANVRAALQKPHKPKRKPAAAKLAAEQPAVASDVAAEPTDLPVRAPVEPAGQKDLPSRAVVANGKTPAKAAARRTRIQTLAKLAAPAVTSPAEGVKAPASAQDVAAAASKTVSAEDARVASVQEAQNHPQSTAA